MDEMNTTDEPLSFSLTHLIVIVRIFIKKRKIQIILILKSLMMDELD